MIKLQNISKVYRTDTIETTALNDINLEIKAGEFVAIVGPSGCGKTTLLNLIGLIDSPDSGDLYFLDKNVSKINEQLKTALRKKNIGFIFQSFNLIDELTVYENVELPFFYQNFSVKERKQKVLELLDRLEISHRKNHFPQQLSGGQQQRVAVARAVATNPKLILADEPTGNLDSQNGEEVMQILQDLHKEGTAIVMVTHSPAHAKMAEREIHLFDGKIIKSDLNGKI
ncbi:MAG: ABC transporter ATP-binding protein [Candidatus Cloacimonetes bacterium]|nr:ABC transporter ATP-binding protein [Candidatus Cloacimonadota bacterium]MDD4156383.1 ABC transporter ATP-binding protein [Candidatus Cloacimonadota bacterium]